MTINQIATQTTTTEITESSEIWRVGIDWRPNGSLRVDVFAKQRAIVGEKSFEGPSEQITAIAPSIQDAIANTAQMFANHPSESIRNEWGQEKIARFFDDMASYFAAVHTMGKLAQEAAEDEAEQP